jgi:hypothetical protein
MIIIFGDKTPISAADMISMTYRTDLIPVPANLELTTQSSADLTKRLIEGAKLFVGMNSIPMTIVKVQSYRSQTIRDGRAIGGINVVAVLTGCEALIKSTPKAIILKNTSLSEAYRACGATITFAQDIPLPAFTCLKGQKPTEEIARRMQSEGAFVHFNGSKIEVIRLSSLISADVMAHFDPSAVQFVDNPHVVNQQVPAAISVQSNAQIIAPSQQDNRPIVYRGRKDERELLNLERVLVTKAVLMRPLDERLKAGNSIAVGDRKMVILTSVHRCDTGALGGNSAMASKAWLAELLQ